MQASPTLAADQEAVAASRRRAASPLAIYRWPLLAAAVALPLVAAACVASLQWFAAPFPGFFVMRNGIVPTVSGVNWPPNRERFFHAQVIAVDGVAVADSAAIYAAAAAKPLGTPITYTLRKDGATYTETVPTMRFGTADYLQTCGVMLLFGCAWLAFALAVGFLQPHTRQAHVYLLLGVVAGLYPVAGIFLHRPDHPLLSAVYFLLECVFPATWIHLALVFPIERRLRGWRRWLIPGAYTVSGALAVAVFAGLARRPPDLAALHAVYLYAGIGVLVFIAGLALAFRRTVALRHRLRAKAVLPGAILAGTLALFALADSAVAGRSFPVQFGLLLTPAFFAAVAYAIATQDLFDIDRVIRLSFTYAVLSIVVTACYAALLSAFAGVVPGGTDRQRAALGVAYVVALAFAFDPLRRLVQRGVDRAFAREPVDYRATLLEVSRLLTTLLDVREVVTQVTRVLTEVMPLQSAAVCLCDPVGDATPVLWQRQASGGLGAREASPAFAELVEVLARADAPMAPAEARALVADAAARAALARELPALAVALLLPLRSHGRAIGFLALGPKRSARSFGGDDVALLRTLANQLAIALQNARSYESLAGLTQRLDAEVQQQTSALRASNAELARAMDELKQAQAQLVQSEKMASLGQLVAGVAHELNNPASFVHGGLANLGEYLSRFVELLRAYEAVPIADPGAADAVAAVRQRVRVEYLLRETPELLRICAEGSARVKQIVDDLRIFARADQGERAPTDLAADLDGALRMLADRVARGAVTVTRAYDDAGVIDAHAGQLNQVWMNLLGNALDALEGVSGAALALAVHREPATAEAPAAVVVRVGDNGAGIAREALPRVFDPFFTTKPVGRGTGLGLAIAYGAVKAHGGTIAIDSAPGRGTTVTVRLPVAG